MQEQCGYHGNRWLHEMGPLTLCTCPTPSHQVWSPSVHKHQRRRLPKLSCIFLVKCGLKACFSGFRGNPLDVSWREYFSCHPWPMTYPVAKTPSKSDRNWRKIKDSDIRVLLKRYIYIYILIYKLSGWQHQRTFALMLYLKLLWDIRHILIGSSHTSGKHLLNFIYFWH